MATVNVELPGDLAARLNSPNISAEDARLIALELFREGKISLGLAAELRDTPLVAFMDFAANHGVPPLRYSHEDLEAEPESIERFGA
jgi:predicted HTH domain antitoxin